MNRIQKLLLAGTFLLVTNGIIAQKSDFEYYISGEENALQVLNREGKPITNETFTSIGVYSEGLFVVEKDEKYGYMDKNGRIVIPCMYDSANEMIKGVAIVQINEKYGLIDKKGKYIITPTLDNVYYNNLKIGLITFEKDGLQGVLDIKGKVKIANKFESIGTFSNGLAPAAMNGKSGLIDDKGNTIIPFKYKYISEFDNGKSIAFIDNEKTGMGLMDLKENVLLNPEYEFVFAPKGEMVYLKKGGKKGLSDASGKLLLSTEYEEDYQTFNEGLMVIEKDKKFGFANTKGEIVIPIIYDGANWFSEGLAPVLKDGKWGFINTKGETVIDFKFTGVMMPFEDGYAAYGKRNSSSLGHYTSDLWGLIDKKGNVVIQNKYSSAGTGYNSNFVVEKDGKKMLINKNEEVLVLLKYEERPVMLMSN